MKNSLYYDFKDIFKSIFKASIHISGVNGLFSNIPKGHNRFCFGKKVT